MNVLAVEGVESMQLRSVPIRPLADDEVLIKVAYCGICGSDFPRFFDGAVHSFPQVLGHEFSGTVVGVGSDCAIQLGARVAVAPLIPCKTCAMCLAGRPALCPNYSFIGSRQQGALADYVAVPVGNCVLLPDELSLRAGALVEPLTVALHGLSHLAASPDSSVAVFGAGVIGLMSIMVLRQRGFRNIISIDVSEEKLALANKLGARTTILNVGSNLFDYLECHESPQLCLEVVGIPHTQKQAIQACAKGGSVILIGTCHSDISFSKAEFEQILRGELNIVGSWMSYSSPFPGKEWRDAVQLLAEGEVDADALISHEYDLCDGATAFYDVRNAHGDFLKVLFKIGGENNAVAW